MYSSMELKQGLGILVAVSVSFAPASGADLSKETISTNAVTTSTDATTCDVMTLDDILDVALTLQHIRRHAIAIFFEATRKKSTQLDMKTLSLSAVPKSNFEDQKLYLPLRKGWLCYFIGTMEPLVQILNEQLKHLDEVATRNAIPADKMPEWHGIVKEWTTAVHELDTQLDICARVLDEPSPGNVEVAKCAQAIDQQVSVLESILLRSAKLKEEVNRPG
jgi:hypothetical protein